MCSKYTACSKFRLLLLLWSLQLSTINVTGQEDNSGEPKRLNDFIAHYEELTYDSDELHAHHNRARRSVTDPYVELKFNAHGRSFHLRLRRDTTTFSKDFKQQAQNGTLVDHDTSYIYEGELWGEPNTNVYGSIIDGVFAGVIETPKSTYHVEKAEHYFRGDRKKRSFHSIIYGDHHIQFDALRKRREANGDGGGTCANDNKDVKEWMQRVQNSAVKEPVEKMEQELPKNGRSDRPIFQNIYTKEYNRMQEEKKTSREKRQTGADRRTCPLLLQSDPMMWSYMRSMFDEDDERAFKEITAFFSLHVKGVQTIYGDHVFENKHIDKRFVGFSFTVRRIMVNTTAICQGETNKISKFCEKNIDVSNFLNLNSLMNHNEYCLAYVFTYRDFTQGTLGLAWVGSWTTAAGGICETWKEYRETGTRVSKSLNTGIVTILNYGQRVPPKVSTLTFAHEIGHNFGSNHDEFAECKAQGDGDGNYIMFASATSGDLLNNNRFSSCSINNMTSVLDGVLNELNGKKNCFVTSEEAYCGNKLVEDTEQCDCGYADDCDDECCHAYLNQNLPPNAKCTLKTNAQCSPTAGPCCTTDCKKVTFLEKKLCRKEDSCTEESFCDGSKAACPTPTPKANLTACNRFTQVCISGECTLSICNTINWNQCQLKTKSPEEEKADPTDKATLCYVACLNPTTKECVSTGNKAKIEQPEHVTLKAFLAKYNRTKGIQLSAGAPCDDFKGYCDVFQKCRGVDADGPLARLKNLLLSVDSLENIRDWMVKHWWAVLLIVVGCIIVMGLFVTVCAVHTPSSNPKRPAARKLSLKPQASKHHVPPKPSHGHSMTSVG